MTIAPPGSISSHASPTSLSVAAIASPWGAALTGASPQLTGPEPAAGQSAQPVVSQVQLVLQASAPDA